jgi:hypothetical protein
MVDIIIQSMPRLWLKCTTNLEKAIIILVGHVLLGFGALDEEMRAGYLG